MMWQKVKARPCEALSIRSETVDQMFVLQPHLDKELAQ